MHDVLRDVLHDVLTKADAFSLSCCQVAQLILVQACVEQHRFVDILARP